jgi:hypothetical protein
MYRCPNCCILNCHTESCRTIFNNPYCDEHFGPAIKKAFVHEYQKWDGKSENTKLMMNLFSIYSEHKYDRTVWPVYLSRARIRDRSYNIKKITDGFTFCIVRYLNAWNDFKWAENVEQIYRFNIVTEGFQLLSQDPDGSVNKEAHKIADAILSYSDHPAIIEIESQKYSKLRIISPKEVKAVLSTYNEKPRPREVKRLKNKIKFLVGLYTDLKPISYRKMLTYGTNNPLFTRT